jgi:hypothetical protein
MPKAKTVDEVLGLDGLSARGKTSLLKVGKEFGSDRTLAQSDKTLGAYGTYGAAVADFGFGADDAAQLEATRQGLLDAGVTRKNAETAKKTTNGSYLAAVGDGKMKRTRGRTILATAVGLLELQGSEEALAAEQSAAAVLSQTVSSEDDATKLADQLDALRGELEKPVVAKLMKTRGAPKAVKDLAASSTKLRAVAPTGVTRRGTPAETERLDLLDGMIVRLCRAARKAARQVAKETGEEAIATAFELSELYPARGRNGNGGAPGGNGGGNEGNGGGGGPAGGK